MKKTLLDYWKEHPTRRSELAALMQEPAFVDALAIIKEQLYAPQYPPTGSGSYNLMEFYAIYGAKKMGAEETLHNFLRLAEINVHQMPDRKPWDSPDKDAILKKQIEELNPPKPV